MNSNDAADESRAASSEPMEWLTKLRARVDEAGGADVIHLVEDEAPRLRKDSGSGLTPLDDMPPLTATLLNAVIAALLKEGGEEALDQTGEVEMPLPDWQDAGGGWWVAHVFKAGRGGRRLLLRRYANANQWLEEMR